MMNASDAINATTTIFTAIELFSYSATCAQLLCYRRGVSNYRVHISLLAWVMIVFSGTSALEILLGYGHTSFGQAGLALTWSALVFRAQGNVSHILRGNR
ncbi:phage holin family protein [Glaciimonas sp. PAMC28666]|uniref:phage holin family protein n=1 Tax=Glaciimonas sp. PAMC28666 TaxID=2807626 RepID=UPI001964AA65|nr:phage holin family protein [Glaciimonas sp. PAMC28666]QRX80869.1 phage holin family protein [Glaciimonas sp. PAMC28666]